jgi:hypothetical protein
VLLQFNQHKTDYDGQQKKDAKLQSLAEVTPVKPNRVRFVNAPSTSVKKAQTE